MALQKINPWIQESEAGMNTKRWIQDEESGQGLVEYALILIIASVAAIMMIKGIGTTVSGYFKLAAESF